jgi:serine protease Do
MPELFTSNRPRGYFLATALLVAVGLVIGLGLSAGLDLQRPSTAQKSVVSSSLSALSSPESPFVSVVDQTLPAVVFVDVKKKVAGGDSDDPQSELFRRFFGQDMPRHPQVQPSSGSGFIIDKEGHVLTNNHVVSNASDITVTLNDRRSFKAKVVGTDPETDVAVIQINGDNLPVLRLGDSDRLHIGDWAIAIGNPLGMLRGSVTVGIVSAQGRSDLNIYGGTPMYQDFIQTDASINFGNSGGPLCNIRGEAIGINTAINPSGQGIGFAIPINLAKHVADQLMARGSVKRAMLGVYLAELTPEIAEGFGLARNEQGVIIRDVQDDSPAAHAGLKRNDVVVEFDGQPVTELQKFRIRVADTPVGRKVPVVVLRDGKRVTLDVMLEDRQEDKLAAEPSEKPSTGSDVEQVAGLKVRALTSDERANAKVSGGVVVTEVESGSAAEDAGIQSGDVIQQVGGKDVKTAADFGKMLREVKNQRKHAVLLVTSPNEAPRFVALGLESK